MVGYLLGVLFDRSPFGTTM
jgi:hypothetical protein